MKICICVCLLLCLLAGCSAPVQETVPLAEQPTLPSFSQDASPREQIGAAVEKTAEAGSFCLVFGQIRIQGEQKQEDLTVQRVAVDDQGQYVFLLETQDREVYHGLQGGYMLDKTQSPPVVSPSQETSVFGAVCSLVPNEAFLDGFCDGRLTVSPSNDGSFTYQLSDLTMEALYRLIHGGERSFPEQAEAVGVASIHVDAEGYLTQVRFDAYLPSGVTHSLVIAVEDIGTTQVTAPDWVPEG
ncbi:MAG: hypothetical protein IJW45_05280 [Oscillospiraceae bacterium]|nr:hypothetical protein [Oscillospiraceae bacterium]